MPSAAQNVSGVPRFPACGIQRLFERRNPDLSGPTSDPPKPFGASLWLGGSQSFCGYPNETGVSVERETSGQTVDFRLPGYLGSANHAIGRTEGNQESSTIMRPEDPL